MSHYRERVLLFEIREKGGQHDAEAQESRNNDAVICELPCSVISRAESPCPGLSSSCFITSAAASVIGEPMSEGGEEMLVNRIVFFRASFYTDNSGFVILASI